MLVFNRWKQSALKESEASGNDYFLSQQIKNFIKDETSQQDEENDQLTVVTLEAVFVYLYLYI